MTEVQSIPPQLKHKTQNLSLQTETTKQQLKQPQPHDQAIQQVKTIVQQKLSVEIMPKTQLLNPQNIQKQTQNHQENTSRYGPFHQLSQNAKALLNSQNLNYDINIQPVLTNITQQKDKPSEKLKKSARPKKTQSILTQQSVQQYVSRANPQELQKQILELAKNIRKKVWKKEGIKGNNDDIITNSNNGYKKPDTKQPDHKLRQIYQKRQSLFEKYSYPHSTGVTLAELQKQQQKLKLNKYHTSRVYNEEQQFQLAQQSQSQSPIPSSTTLNMQPNFNKQIHLTTRRSKSRTQDSSSSRKQSQLPKLKLSFDKTHHKYQMTEFRKSILRENKERELAKSLLIKEKEQTLQKRREIYNNSRYHPVGIKLSSLRLSKLANHSILGEKGNLQSLAANPRGNNKDVLQVSTYKINSMQQSSIIQKKQHTEQNQQQIDTNQLNQNPQTLQNKLTTNTTPPITNPSQVKSSLTFNFSFGQPLQTELKTQAQVYTQLQNLTKQLQNDSTPKQKIQKLQRLENSKKKQMNDDSEIKTKKWTTNNETSITNEIDKAMTESKMIRDVEGLHNSSDDQYGEHDKDVELQYSYV